MLRLPVNKGVSGMKIENIFIHCSDSPFGNVLMIDEWHKERGWKGIGYQLVILNGYPFSTGKDAYWKFLDGMPCPGRSLDANAWLGADEVGAHAYGYNRKSVGICLIGLPGKFSVMELTTSRVAVRAYMEAFDLTVDKVKGHSEVDSKKTCPGIDMDVYRQLIQTPTLDSNVLQELIQ